MGEGNRHGWGARVCSVLDSTGRGHSGTGLQATPAWGHGACDNVCIAVRRKWRHSGVRDRVARVLYSGGWYILYAMHCGTLFAPVGALGGLRLALRTARPSEGIRRGSGGNLQHSQAMTSRTVRCSAEPEC
eukprot:2305156-Prymnesium_polylepis.1